MKLILQREHLLKPLQLVSGVVEKRQTLPILSNVLLRTTNTNQLHITGTDLEVELESHINLPEPAKSIGDITVPGRKLMDIFRTLPEEASVELYLDKDKVMVCSGRSRFSLSTLPAKDFPSTEKGAANIHLSLPQKDLKFLLQRTYFAMAHQDVRYYLNGMLIEIAEGIIRAVATDGHRLALNAINAPTTETSALQIIVPYKGITELTRLLEDNDEAVTIAISPNNIQVNGPTFTFTSKLMDGNYPDYNRVLPKGCDKVILVDRDLFKQALVRAAVLSNEKFRGVSLEIKSDILRVLANNPEQEEAEDAINIDYNGSPLTIGFNVSYLLDVLNVIDPGTVKISLKDADSSIVLEEADTHHNSYFVVMPMRL